MPLSQLWWPTRAQLAANLLIWACSHVYAAAVDTWKEEVLLHDGQKIVVERSQNYGGRHEVGQSPPVREHTISLVLPDGGRAISWTSEYSEDVGASNFNLLALHFKDGVPYLVAEPNLCISYNKWGRPNPPYVLFKYDGSQWLRITLEELPVEFKTINLIVNIYRQREIRDESRSAGFVRTDAIVKLNRGIRSPELKSILREPLPRERVLANCDVRVLYKGYWLRPDDTIAREFIDSQKK